MPNAAPVTPARPLEHPGLLDRGAGQRSELAEREAEPATGQAGDEVDQALALHRRHHLAGERDGVVPARQSAG